MKEQKQDQCQCLSCRWLNSDVEHINWIVQRKLNSIRK